MGQQKLFSGDDRLVRLSEFLEELPICRSTWLAGVKKGIYPQPVRISEKAIAWRLAEIRELLKNGVDARKRKKP
ncbi:MAG: helix-turn-helix transcriptional regulator [bacterium]